jgi:hypothetical protein
MKPTAFVKLVAAQLAEGEYHVAIDMACEGLRRFGDVTRLWECRGLAAWMLDQDGGASYALESASVLAPLHPLSQCALLDLYARGGDWRAAGAIAEFLGAEHQAASLLAAVTGGDSRLGGIDLALRACLALAAEAPDHDRAQFGVAWCLARQGASWERLVEPLALAMDLAPGRLHYRLNLAFAWADGGRWSRAYELLREVEVGDVCCPCWLSRMREVFEEAGDAPRARACSRRLQAVSELGPAWRRGAAPGEDRK